MMKSTVSIIVPIYKVEKYLRECVDSVLAQTFTDFELLLVDDGSPDRCGEICDEYAARDPRVRALHKVNGGLSSARNYGMCHANGKWIMFLDSDDLWGDSDGLRKLVEYAEKHDLDALRFEYQAIDEHGKHINPRPFDGEKQLPAGAFGNYTMVDKAIAGEWFAVLYLLKREAIAELRFDESMPFQEDIDFYCRLFAAKEIRCGYIPYKIYLYRKRDESLSTRINAKNLQGSFRLCDTFYEQSRIVKDTNLQGLYRYNAVMMYYWTLCTLAEPPYYKDRNGIIKNLNLIELHERTKLRLRAENVSNKYRIFISPKPEFGVVLLKLKNRIVSSLKNWRKWYQ